MTLKLVATDQSPEPTLWEQFHKVWGQSRDGQYHKRDWMRLQELVQEATDDQAIRKTPV